MKALAVSQAYNHYLKYCLKTPEFSVYGVKIWDILRSENHSRHLHAFRMTRDTFMKLVAFCGEHTELRATREVSVEEKLGIFLYIVSNGVSFRAAKEHWARALGTISTAFSEVLDALLILHQHYVVLPSKDRPLDARIQSSRKYYPYFKDVAGALDGTHIYAFLPSAQATPYRNRKNTLTQNVLGVCTLDLQFCFVYPGWEGSAHDTRVVEDAQERGGFHTPEGKYWLADAGYPNKYPFLVPYRGTRYHLREQALANQKPQNYKELFNLRHSSLRNVIERIFGVLKRRFKILSSAPEYTLQKQKRLVFALTALHNFIRTYDRCDVFEEEERKAEAARRADEEVIRTAAQAEQERIAHRIELQERNTQWQEWRDTMAKKIWEHYVEYSREDS